MLLKRLMLVMVLVLLSGCVSMRAATQAPNNTKQTAQQTEQRLSQINHWQLRGAIAVKTPKKAFTASISWQQKLGKRYLINIMGPLSVGATRLSGRPGLVVLQQANAKPIQASSPEQLLQQNAGWSLPVSNLYYWIRGLPAPGAVQAKQFDRYGHLKTLQQQGWSIQYLRYTGVGRYDLPSKLEMRRQGVFVKLIVSSWQL